MNKEEYAEIAAYHTELMAELYADKIEKAVKDTKAYGFPDREPLSARKTSAPEFLFVNLDSVSAAFAVGKGKTAILNFASFKHPGGGFMTGMNAQEENLCHESFLYNVLREFPGFYSLNNRHKNKGLYTNRALYSPDVIFISGTQVKAFDVLTCAAPNKRPACRYFHVTQDENRQVLNERIRFVSDIVNENKPDTFIAGAFGCGVFGQDPREVAEAFKKVFEYSEVKKIVFAVPGEDENVRVFSECSKKEKPLP